MNSTNLESWFPRCRMAWLERQAKAAGHVGRHDLMETFGISPAQASSDLQAYLSINPQALIYHTSRKRYEWVEGAKFVIVPAPWESLLPGALPGDDFPDRVAMMGIDELRSRVLTQRDYHRRFASCLDGLPIPVGIDRSIDGCRDHHDIRSIVEKLLQ